MPAASVSPPPFPERVGKYELLLPIGTGGMATVYLARTTGVGGFERRVALKLMHAHLRADEESKLHLLEEAKLAALIRHPNVVRVQEIDEDPFGVFLVMDYVEGDTLAGIARLAKQNGTPLPRRMMARILNDALLGLHAAHQLRDAEGKALGLVHRDFSPQNILVGVEGHTQLGDFGVAKAADRAVRTKTGLTKGKIAYMSPEQARGRSVDRRCDVWAAGVVAWELIADRRMFDSDDDVATLLSIVTEHPRRLSAVLDDVPKALDDAVASALEPELDKRCPDAEQFRKALAAAWEEADGTADAAELAEFVRQVTRRSLKGRQDRIEEVRGLRERMEQLTTASNVVAEATPVSEPRSRRTTRSDHPSRPLTAAAALLSASDDERYSLESAPTSPAHDSVDEARISHAQAIAANNQNGEDEASSAPTRVLSTQDALLRPPEELTETSAVVPTWAEPTRRHRTVIAASAAALLGLGAVWYFGSNEPVATNEQAAREAAAAQSASAKPATAAKPTEKGQTQSAPLESQKKPAREVIDIASLPLEEAAPTPKPSAQVKRAPRPKPKKAQRPRPTPSQKPPKSDKPRLATSPYEGQKSGK